MSKFDPPPLFSLSLGFEVPGDRDTWREFANTIGASFTGEDAWVLGLTALPVEGGTHYLIGSVHPHDDAAHWTLELRQTPHAPPPRQMLSDSARMGGYPTVARRMAAAWPGPSEFAARYTATYVLPRRAWRGLGAFGRPKKLHQQGQDQRAWLDRATWRIEPPLHEVLAISEHVVDERTLAVAASGSTTLAPSATMFEDLGERAWKTLSILIR